MNFPSWSFAIILYFLFFTWYSLQQRRISQTSKLPMRLLPALVNCIILYPAAVAVALFSGNLTFHYSPLGILYLLIANILLGIYLAFVFKLNKYIDATQYIIITNINTPITVFIGVFLLQEAFHGKQFVGMILLIFGAILVALKGIKGKTWQLDHHSIELILFSLLMGIALALEKAALSYMSVYFYMIFGWGLQFLVTGLLVGKDWKLVTKIPKNEWSEIIKAGFSRCVWAISYILAVSSAKNIALISTVTTFRIPLIFIASYFILKERDHLGRKLAGVVIATVGLLLLK